MLSHIYSLFSSLPKSWCALLFAATETKLLTKTRIKDQWWTDHPNQQHVSPVHLVPVQEHFSNVKRYKCFFFFFKFHLQALA